MMTADNNEQNPEATMPEGESSGGLLDEVAKAAAEEAKPVEGLIPDEGEVAGEESASEASAPDVPAPEESVEPDEEPVEPSADTSPMAAVEETAEEPATDEPEPEEDAPQAEAVDAADEEGEPDEADAEEPEVEAAGEADEAGEEEEEEPERDPVTGEIIVEPEPVVITATPDDGKRWYVVHTYSGYENKAKQALEDRIRAHAMEKFFGDVLVPSEKVTEMRGGNKRTTTRKFFPGYMFVRMELNDQTWHLVKNTPRVTGFVGGGKNPPPVPDEEVSRITNQIKDGTLKPTPTLAFEKGETVRVVEGPFMNFNGIVEEVLPDKQRVKVIVSILGRSTPVEFDFDEIEKT